MFTVVSGSMVPEYEIGDVLVSKETDPAKKAVWFQDLMKCYDQRVKYFGNDKKYPEAWIRGRQAMDYIAYSPEKDYLTMALPWLEQAVNHGKSNADSDVIQKYFELLEARYQSDKAKYSESKTREPKKPNSSPIVQKIKSVCCSGTKLYFVMVPCR